MSAQAPALAQSKKTRKWAMSSRFRKPSIGATLGIVVSAVVAGALVGFGYPAALSILTDLGECTSSCLAQAELSARYRGILFLVPFVLVGFLVYLFGSTPSSQRKGSWVILLGAYVCFFPVVYWATS